jgi:hypothetical protein
VVTDIYLPYAYDHPIHLNDIRLDRINSIFVFQGRL